MTPSGIEPTTFRLVTQSLDQLRPRLPPKFQLEISENKVVVLSSSKLLDHLKTIQGPQVTNGWSIR